jgi:hypothetical protein
LHGDGAEALSNTAGAEIPCDGAQHAMPVETVMFIEAPVFRGDECVANRLGYEIDRYVDATNRLEMSEQLSAAIVHVATFARMEGANLGGRWTAAEAAGSQPGVERDDADAREREQTEPRPMPPQPARGRVRRVSSQAPSKKRHSVVKLCDGHAVAVVSILKNGTLSSLAGFWPRSSRVRPTR